MKDPMKLRIKCSNGSYWNRVRYGSLSSIVYATAFLSVLHGLIYPYHHISKLEKKIGIPPSKFDRIIFQHKKEIIKDYADNH